MGTSDTTVSTSPDITGKVYGIYSTSTFNYYDGILKGAKGTSIYGTITKKPDGYGLQKTTASSVETTILVKANYGEYNSSTLVSNYETLGNAFKYVTNNNTIKPLVNMSEKATTLETGKIAILDLNSKTITMTSSLTNSGTLTITGAGTLKGNSLYTIKNNGTFTKTGTSTISNTESTFYALDNNGTATINGGTMSSPGTCIDNESTKKLTISSGTITGGDNGITNKGTVTITGGTITGNFGIDNSGTLTIQKGTITGTTSAGVLNTRNIGYRYIKRFFCKYKCSKYNRKNSWS